MNTVGTIVSRESGVMNALPMPSALDPTSFSAPPGVNFGSPQATTATSTPVAGDGTLSDTDRASLSVFLSLLRSARAEAASEDKAVAKKGAWRVAVLMCYLAGFFDARGLLDEFKVADAGFEALIGSSVKPDMKLMLDEVENGLAKALVSLDTRSGMSDALHGAAHVAHELGTGLLIEATVMAIAGMVV